MSKHFVEPEELQAYLDRELDSNRQREVERHLGECRECQVVLGDLKRVSETLRRWQVEPAPASLRLPAVEEAGSERRLSWRRLTWAVAGTAVVALLVFGVLAPNLMKSRMGTPVAQRDSRDDVLVPQPPPPAAEPPKSTAASRPAPPPASPAEADREALARSREEFEKKDQAVEGGEVGGMAGGTLAYKTEGRVAADEAQPGAAMRSQAAPKTAAAPPGLGAAKSALPARLVAYRATMTLEVKEFAAAKEKLLQTVAEAGGYVAQASAAETPNQPQRADLTVRVPAEKLAAVLEELRGLGRVVQEQLSSEEVTAQVVDLEARLRNSRVTEARLIRVLEERTGKVADILQVEREIARTREEIERMEAQRKNLVQRVEFATVSVALVEEFKAQLAPAPVGTTTRLRNAFVEGYENFVGLLLGFVFFFARNGLVLLFWLTLVWLGWRLIRRPLWRLVSTRG